MIGRSLSTTALWKRSGDHIGPSATSPQSAQRTPPSSSTPASPSQKGSASRWNAYMVDASRSARGPMRAPERLVVPSSQPMPTTATSASAVVGAASSGALKKVAMPLNGSAS